MKPGDMVSFRGCNKFLECCECKSCAFAMASVPVYYGRIVDLGGYASTIQVSETERCLIATSCLSLCRTRSNARVERMVS